MIPVSNPTDKPIIIPVNGKAWLFPPAKSKANWKVVENPKVKVGETPYEAKEVPPREGGIRGPTVHVPDHVAYELVHSGYCQSRGSKVLRIGKAAMDDEAARFEAVKAAQESAEAELANLRAEIEAQRAKITREK